MAGLHGGGAEGGEQGRGRARCLGGTLGPGGQRWEWVLLPCVKPEGDAHVTPARTPDTGSGPSTHASMPAAGRCPSSGPCLVPPARSPYAAVRPWVPGAGRGEWGWGTGVRVQRRRERRKRRRRGLSLRESVRRQVAGRAAQLGVPSMGPAALLAQKLHPPPRVG